MMPFPKTKKTRGPNKRKKTSTAPVDTTPYLYVDYTASRTGGEDQEGESGPFAQREDEHIDFEIRGIYRSLPKDVFFHHREEVAPEVTKADKVWVVLVRYTTGNTFGTTHGAWHIYSIQSDSRRAEGDKRMIEFDDRRDNMTDQWNYNKLSDFAKKLISKKKHLIEGYVPWRGYFEKLETVEVLEFPVK